MAKPFVIPPVCEHEALAEPGTRYEVQWDVRRAPLREGMVPCRVIAVGPDERQSTCLISAVKEGMQDAYAADIARLGGHSPVEQRRMLHLLKYSPGHTGNEIPEAIRVPAPATPNPFPTTSDLFV